MRYRNIMNLLWISLPICVLLRALQLIFTIDSTTGFVKQQYSEISVIISFIVCAAIAAITLLALVADGVDFKSYSVKPPVAAASALLGGMFIYETLYVASSLSAGSWRDILLVFLSLLSALTFVAYGLRNVYYYKFPHVMLIAPVAYYTVKIIDIFVSTSSLALVTENIFLIFSNSALLWFMFEFASYENDIGDILKKPKKLFASGIASVLLCGVTALPKFILFISSEAEVSRDDLSASLLNAAIGIFVLLYIIYSFGRRKISKRQAAKHLA